MYGSSQSDIHAHHTTSQHLITSIKNCTAKRRLCQMALLIRKKGFSAHMHIRAVHCNTTATFCTPCTSVSCRRQHAVLTVPTATWGLIDWHSPINHKQLTLVTLSLVPGANLNLMALPNPLCLYIMRVH